MKKHTPVEATSEEVELLILQIWANGTRREADIHDRIRESLQERCPKILPGKYAMKTISLKPENKVVLESFRQDAIDAIFSLEFSNPSERIDALRKKHDAIQQSVDDGLIAPEDMIKACEMQRKLLKDIRDEVRSVQSGKSQRSEKDREVDQPLSGEEDTDNEEDQHIGEDQVVHIEEGRKKASQG